jgi:HEAT repeat protein
MPSQTVHCEEEQIACGMQPGLFTIKNFSHNAPHLTRSLARVNLSQVDEYIPQLKHQNDYVRQDAAAALGEIGDASAVPALIETLKDQHDNVRRTAAEALEKIGDAFAVPALIEALTDEESSVRLNATKALRKIEDGSAVHALIEVLNDRDEGVRANAAAALGEIGDSSAVPALIEALTDRVDSVSSNAAEALGEIGDAVTLPRKILTDARLTAHERVEILDKLCRVQYRDASFTLRYFSPDARTLCQMVLTEQDNDAREAAQTVLNWLNGDRNLLIPSQPDTTHEAEQLLRASRGGVAETQPETLLQPSSAPEQTAEAHRTLWQRLFGTRNDTAP